MLNDACKRDRMSWAKSISLLRNVDVAIGVTVVVSVSTILFDSDSVVVATFELTSADWVDVTSDICMVLLSTFSVVLMLVASLVVDVMVVSAGFVEIWVVDVTSVAVVCGTLP